MVIVKKYKLWLRLAYAAPKYTKLQARGCSLLFDIVCCVANIICPISL